MINMPIVLVVWLVTALAAPRLVAQDGSTCRVIADQRVEEPLTTIAEEFTRLTGTEVKLQFRSSARIGAWIGKKPKAADVVVCMPEDLDAKLDVDESHRELMRDMHARAEMIEAAAMDKKDDFKMLIESLESQVGMLASTPAIRPTNGWVTSGFGYRKDPFTKSMHFLFANSNFLRFSFLKSLL